MTIQYKFFTIPARDGHEAESELNRFLRSVKTMMVHREFVNNEENSFWSFSIEYLYQSANQKSNSEKQGKIDYKSILSPEDFAVFVKLREWRKETAAKEAIPVYTIFTNEQLSKIVKNQIKKIADLKSIQGIGDARVQKYGSAILKILDQGNEAGRTTL